MNAVIKGLVIRETPFGEYDSYITLLTEGEGKISVLCKGLRKRSSKYAASVRLFCYSEFTIFESRGKYTLSDAQFISQFWTVTQDIEKYGLCCYFAQLVDNNLSELDTDRPDFLRLFLCALYALTKQNRDIEIVKSAFEMRFMSMIGFMPQLVECGVCQNELSMPYFIIEEGILVCNECYKRIGAKYIQISDGALHALRFIISSDIKKLFSFSVGEDTKKILCEVCEKYTLYHLARGFETLDFYKSLKVEIKK